MKTIIAGSRSIDDEALVFRILDQVAFPITEVVCGMAPGVDLLGKAWADAKGIPVIPFPADWKNIYAPGALIRSGRYGNYNAKAGFDRNEKMAEYAEACVLLWDGESGGTQDMHDRAMSHGLKVFLYDALTEEMGEDLF